MVEVLLKLPMTTGELHWSGYSTLCAVSLPGE